MRTATSGAEKTNPKRVQRRSEMDVPTTPMPMAKVSEQQQQLLQLGESMLGFPPEGNLSDQLRRGSDGVMKDISATVQDTSSQGSEISIAQLRGISSSENKELTAETTKRKVSAISETQTTGGMTTTAAAASGSENPQPPKKRGPGAIKGQSRVEYPRSKWYQLCEIFTNNAGKYKSQAAFLRHPDSGEFTSKHQMSFSRHLAQYRKGQLRNEDMMRSRRKRKYEAIEQRMLEYLTLRRKMEAMLAVGSEMRPGALERRHLPDLCFNDFKELSERWATELKVEFTCTASWVTDVTKQFRALEQEEPKRTVPKESSVICNLPAAKASLENVKNYCQRQGMPSAVYSLCDSISFQMEKFMDSGGQSRSKKRKAHIYTGGDSLGTNAGGQDETQLGEQEAPMSA